MRSTPRRKIERFLIVLALTALALCGVAFAQTTPTLGEKQIGNTPCTYSNTNADFDTLAQCTSTGATSGTFQKAPLFVGAVTSPPYLSTNCDSTKAGMIQYTASSFQVCDGSSWTTLGNSYSSCDASMVLLLHMDGTNGSTTFTDSSLSANTVTSSGVTLNTNYSKFGGTSGYFNGSSALLIPDSTNWTFGSNDFTIDLWAKQASTTGNQILIGQGNSGGNQTYTSFELGFDLSNRPYFVPVFNGIWGAVVTSPTAITDTSWHHYAIVRYGNVFTLYVDGTAVTSSTQSGSLTDSANRFGIGVLGEMTSLYFIGYIDEFRVSKGVARWTSNFSPPATAYVAKPCILN